MKIFFASLSFENFFLYLLYLSVPSLYDTGRVQKVLYDKILKEFQLNLSLSSKELKIVESLNFDLTTLLLAKTSFIPAQELIFNKYGTLESILIANHRIDYETYINFDNFSIPKKVIVSNESYEITFSLKMFEKT